MFFGFRIVSDESFGAFFVVLYEYCLNFVSRSM